MSAENSFTYLLRISEAATLLGLTPGAARRWLEQNKVPMIDYGPGRGLGLRWPRDHVLEAVERKLIYKADASVQRRKSPSRPLSGRSMKELLDELAGPTRGQ